MKMRFASLTMAMALVGLCLSGCFDDDDDNDILGNDGDGTVSHAVANLRGYADTNIVGTVRFDESGDSLVISAVINGLTPGQLYGIHVHENGNCSAPELSGPHFHQAEPHGNPHDSEGTHHRGDLPNVQTDANGVGHVSFSTDAIDLETLERSVVNRSVVLHVMEDDYVTQPSGNSGDRIACGIILTSTGADTTGIDTTGTGDGDIIY